MAGMRRRDFIAAVGSTAVAWPARAQQAERMRHPPTISSYGLPRRSLHRWELSLYPPLSRQQPTSNVP